ncbi:MAG: PIG-L deacetylase family protein [Candidatus Nealsonbacteria bacterium]
MENNIEFKGKTILVIGAHPDDNDFICGATVSRAVKEGAKVVYVIATSGQRGSNDENITPDELGEIRKAEQREAASLLGVSEIHFLEYCDGELDPDIKLKEKLVRLIRQYKPDYVFSMNPSHYFYKEYGFINHSDHRAIGEAVLDAVYPLARDRLSFSEHREDGLLPHKVKVIFLGAFLKEDANYFIDVTDTFDDKIKALILHKSQINEPDKLRKRMEERASEAGQLSGFKLAESFIRLQMPE